MTTYHQQRLRTRGFTLIEILVALTLFAILAAITSSAMYHAFNTRQRVSLQAERLNALQLTISLIKQDMENVAGRAVRSQDLRLLPALVGQNNRIDFTRGGFPNPKGASQRSTLQRIALLCQKNKLIRRTWETLDTPTPGVFQDRILLRNIDHCYFAFLDTNLEVLNTWQSGPLSENAPPQSLLPTAVQVNITLPGWGKGVFLFLIPAAVYNHV